MTQSTLIILAHPEPRSFNGTWARASQDACEALGHRCLFSDLVSMEFDPVEREVHYGEMPVGNVEEPFDPLKLQELASSEGMLPADVASEIVKIQEADRIIFHFPLWWFGPPAILKGWFDRCLVHGALHSTVERFDTGKCRGKKALFCVSTGSTALESSAAGKEGDVMMLLWPLAYTLRYLGFTVLKPRLVHGVHGYHTGKARIDMESRLKKVISTHTAVISRFDELPTIPFNRDTDFDEHGLLKISSPSYCSFIRHEFND